MLVTDFVLAIIASRRLFMGFHHHQGKHYDYLRQLSYKKYLVKYKFCKILVHARKTFYTKIAFYDASDSYGSCLSCTKTSRVAIFSVQ